MWVLYYQYKLNQNKKMSLPKLNTSITYFPIPTKEQELLIRKYDHRKEKVKIN